MEFFADVLEIIDHGPVDLESFSSYPVLMGSGESPEWPQWLWDPRSELTQFICGRLDISQN